MPSGQYSVCQFFDNDTYEYVRRYVDGKEAVAAFHHYTHNIAVTMGIIEKVIITDGGDCTVAEWKKGEGLVWPTQEAIEAGEDQKAVPLQRRDPEGNAAQEVPLPRHGEEIGGPERDEERPKPPQD